MARWPSIVAKGPGFPHPSKPCGSGDTKRESAARIRKHYTNARCRQDLSLHCAHDVVHSFHASAFARVDVYIKLGFVYVRGNVILLNDVVEGYRRENHDKRVRIAADLTPDHVHGQRADARADERDTDEVPEEHDQRAHGAAAQRGKDEHRAIAGTQHGRRGERPDVKPEQREDEAEQPVPGGPCNDTAHDDKDKNGKLV